ncbi:Flp pilus assembly complex ATPase component TadA [Candidatus Woesearchaeota archaeon]|nr:Flp pilus assembly complex ATPase component TadA [Candidatus Woesearchaeota archaeon]
MKEEKEGGLSGENLIDNIPSGVKIIEEYTYQSSGIPIKVRIFSKKGEFVRLYDISITKISRHSLIILDKIRDKIIEETTIGSFDIFEKEGNIVEAKYRDVISKLVDKYFPTIDDDTRKFFVTFLVQRSLGLGTLEIISDDPMLEEIAINNANEPIWVFHDKYGWLKSDQYVTDEEQIKHFAVTVGRKVGRQITIAHPMMDANLENGDRLNSTLYPISTRGNTFTLRKFRRDPWTVTSFIESNTLSIEAASLIWMAVEYEFSCLVVGGTASGKTSMLNVISDLFPPNQRVISIEDTREVQLPSHCHWVPMATRLSNVEGKGGVAMLDLLNNSLRMRPDRIVVGEVRTKEESETLFAAINTGHSVYSTFHANDVVESITRLKNAPLMIPDSVISGLGLIIVQFRNRRIGSRRTFQIAEILEGGDYNILYQYDPKADKLKKIGNSKRLFKLIKLFSGYDETQLKKDLKIRNKVLTYMVKKKLFSVEDVGMIIAEYYTDRKNLLKQIK